ncbi:hypothetical protein AB4P95_30010 (plasmid) [Pseudomonas sp. A1437]|uniref:hypothetical protein n=1 Tax=Pseudomonas sp. A1437 TaxID=3235107 RepID=UPI003784D6D7
MNDYPRLAGLVGLHGLQIVESEHMTRTISWRTERPWSHRKRRHPHRAFKFHSKVAPDNTIIRMDGALVMHPHIAKQLREAMQAKGCRP